MDIYKNENNWGPPLWYIMHSIAYSFPENASEQYKLIYSDFYNKIIPSLILCKFCLYHYRSYIRKKKIDFNSKDNLINWLIDLHNDVNIRNNKIKYNRSDVDKLYRNQAFNHKIYYKFLTYYTGELNNAEKLYNYIELLKYLSIIIPCNGCKLYIIKNFKNKTSKEIYNKIKKHLGYNLIGKDTCLSV